MNLKSKSIGALLGFTVAVSSALPAKAAMTRAPLPAPAITESNVENVQRRRIRRNRGFRNRRYRSRRNRGGAILGGVIAGAIIGGAIRESRARRRDRRSSRYSRHVDWCYDRYRSYRESSDTYQPFNGRRRLCNSPYN